MADRATKRARATSERGQATILMVFILIVTIVIGLGLARIGEAMVHRAQARNAADAIALAAASDSEQGETIAQWYRDQGVIVDAVGSRTVVRSGPSQAGSRVEVVAAGVDTAPAVRAIVARAEQLLDRSFLEVQWYELSVAVPIGAATDLGSVAEELGLCEEPQEVGAPGWITFTLCS